MTQGEIEKLTAKTENIFSELEIRIMSDIVRRIKENNFSTATADWQVRKADSRVDAESVESFRYRNGPYFF